MKKTKMETAEEVSEGVEKNMGTVGIQRAKFQNIRMRNTLSNVKALRYTLFHKKQIFCLQPGCLIAFYRIQP